jgi:hypothetical protein
MKKKFVDAWNSVFIQGCGFADAALSRGDLTDSNYPRRRYGRGTKSPSSHPQNDRRKQGQHEARALEPINAAKVPGRFNQCTLPFSLNIVRRPRLLASLTKGHAAA